VDRDPIKLEGVQIVGLGRVEINQPDPLQPKPDLPLLTSLLTSPSRSNLASWLTWVSLTQWDERCSDTVQLQFSFFGGHS